MKARRPTSPRQRSPQGENVRVSRRGFLGVAAGAAGVTTLVATQLARADAQAEVVDRLPVYGETKVSTICHQCTGGCGITARVLANEVVGLAGNPQHPVNRGGVCPRLFGALELLHAPSRLAGPMVKDGARGRLRKASWDEALGIVTERLSGLRGRGEAHTLAILGGQYRGSRNSVWAQFARAYGTPNYIRARALAPEQPAAAHHFMHGATSPFAYDLAEAQLVVSFGVDLLEGWLNPVHGARALSNLRRTEGRARGRFIHVSPRRSPTAIKADKWVSLEPGTEGILALGLANVLIREQLYDAAYIEDHTLGFEDWVAADGRKYEGFKSLVLRDYGLLAVSAATGVPVNTILEVARELGTVRPAVVIEDPGHSYGPDDLRSRLAIHALNALVGAVGARGGVVPQGALPLAALPALAPDDIAAKSLAQPRIDGAGRGDFALATDAVQNIPARILAGDPYPVNALFLFASNPLVNHPAKEEFARAIDRVPFVVSFSPFADETTAHADVVLPDALFLERWQDDWVTHLAGFTCYSVGQPAAISRSDVRNTADVVLSLAAAIGGPVAQALPFKRFDDVIRHVAKGLFEARRGHVAGTAAAESLYKTLERQGYWTPEFASFDEFFEALSQRGAWFEVPSGPVGRTATFATASGKLEFHASSLADALDEATKRDGAPSMAAKLLRPSGGRAVLPAVAIAQAPVDGAFPLQLSTYELGTRPLGGAHEQPWLLEQPASHIEASWQNWVELHPKTAQGLGIAEGEEVVVESGKGSLRLAAKITSGLREDVVCIPTYNGVGGNPYDLIANIPDYFRGFGLLGTTHVRVRRA